MIRNLVSSILLLLLASVTLAQERYVVTLQFDADDDAEVVTRQLAAMYRLQIDSAGVGASTVTVTASDAAIAMLRNDRRVVAVEAVRPQLVETNLDGFGTYAYDGAGNITQVGNDTFDYDTRGRINSAEIRGITQTFTYDRWGNITKITTTNESDRNIAVDANNRLSGATYDGSGNLTSYHGGTFDYDALNVVKESTPTGGHRHLYLYSASNERIATIELIGAQQQSEWTIRDDAGKVLRRFRKSLSGAWSWDEDYIYRGAQLLAAEVPGPEKVRHFHLDHLGTPRLITGNGGAVIAARTYGAFGRGLNVTSTPAPDEPAQFTGHERDTFQLDYMHARYYDPMIGRFLSVDPTWASVDLGKPQSWNRYSYVLNNPVNAIDPDGRLGFLTNDPEKLRERNEKIIGYTAKAIAVVILDAESTGTSADPPRPGSLEQRAKDIQGALREGTQKRTTTATATVRNADGTTQVLVGSSEKNLRPAQRAAMRAGETAVSGVGHAEQTIINAAAANGQAVEAVAASRPICPSCAAAIKKVGAEAVSVLKRIVTLVF